MEAGNPAVSLPWQGAPPLTIDQQDVTQDLAPGFEPSANTEAHMIGSHGVWRLLPLRRKTAPKNG